MERRPRVRIKRLIIIKRQGWLLQLDFALAASRPAGLHRQRRRRSSGASTLGNACCLGEASRSSTTCTGRACLFSLSMAPRSTRSANQQALSPVQHAWQQGGDSRRHQPNLFHPPLSWRLELPPAPPQVKRGSLLAGAQAAARSCSTEESERGGAKRAVRTWPVSSAPRPWAHWLAGWLAGCYTRLS